MSLIGYICSHEKKYPIEKNLRNIPSTNGIRDQVCVILLLRHMFTTVYIHMSHVCHTHIAV